MDNNFFKHSLYSPIIENVGINIYNSGYQRCGGGHTWGPGVRDYYLIHLVISGKGTFYCDSKEYKIGAGQAFLIRPQTLVSYTADKDNPWEYYWVGFNGADASRLIEMTAFKADAPVIKFSREATEKIQKVLLDLYTSFGTKPEEETKIISKLYETFSLIIKNSPGEKGESTSNRIYIKNAIQFIQRNFSNNIDVSDIANHIGLSRSHLYRVFIKNTGISPNEYLIQYKINQACTLLRTSDLSIGEISSSVGFDDQLYFSRVFKKHKGVPPSQYLKEISNKK